MRYIDYDHFRPSDRWLDKANKATRELIDKLTDEERRTYIKANANIWRELRQELTSQYGNRCWFTDAEESVAPLDIEHFRPKLEARDVDETVHEGYWWLAFDFRNLRLAGQIPNRQYKKCYFPLCDGSKRADSADRRWRDELPVFLDPVNRYDVMLVDYNETGAVCASSSAISAVDKQRVEVTDRLFGLSAHQPLVEARQRIWSECRDLIAQVERSLHEDRVDGGVTAYSKEKRTGLMEQLRRKTDPSQPLFAVAKSCIKNSGCCWAVDLLCL